MYGVQTNVWVKGPMMDTAKIGIAGTGVGGDLYVQGTMTVPRTVNGMERVQCGGYGKYVSKRKILQPAASRSLVPRRRVKKNKILK